MIAALRNRLKGVQAVLDFENWSPTEYPQFADKRSLGRVALLGTVLGFVLGIHAILCAQLTLHLTLAADQYSPLLPMTLVSLLGPPRLQLLWQWCAYVIALCGFHLLEFFVTAFYNPTEATADSFVVNHSTAYTAAALTSWTEFATRFLCFPTYNAPLVSYAGLLIVVVAQTIRSLAMATAGESFNHLIQNVKKENHVLITHGIYSVLRHPSYVGFFYWSIGTQLLLGNLLHAILFAVASWSFFRRRIAYEEESLCRFFPDEYPSYAARTSTGIPFLRTTNVVVGAAQPNRRDGPAKKE